MIRQGMKHKTYCMPLFALALNLSWEFFYGIKGLSALNYQTVINLVWGLFDLLIVYTYFRNGKKYFPEKAKPFFVPYSVLVFACALMMEMVFSYKLTYRAMQYSAWIMNVLISVSTLELIFKREHGEGTSFIIGITKMVGTIFQTIAAGVISQRDRFIVIFGVVCLAFDILYCIAVVKYKEESASYQNKKSSKASE